MTVIARLLRVSVTVAAFLGSVACTTPPTGDADTPAPTAAALEPTDGDLESQCLNAAEILGFAVPCPTLLPPTTAPPRCARSPADIEPNEPCVHGASFVLTPTVTPQSGLYHLVIEASRSPRSDCGRDNPHSDVKVSAENDVQIWYEHAYATGNVDLIAVTNR
jgi:hypothetical protein